MSQHVAVSLVQLLDTEQIELHTSILLISDPPSYFGRKGPDTDTGWIVASLLHGSLVVAAACHTSSSSSLCFTVNCQIKETECFQVIISLLGGPDAPQVTVTVDNR